MFDLDQILDPGALYCLRFRSGLCKGHRTALSLCRICGDNAALGASDCRRVCLYE